MQSMTTYDVKEVSTIIDNAVQFGFQDDDVVFFSKDNSYIEVQTDAQGQSSAAENNDNLGTFTINLSQNSPCNKQLMALVNGHKEFAASVTHSTEKAWASKAYIEKTPDGSFSRGVPTRSYTIKALDYRHEYN